MILLRFEFHFTVCYIRNNLMERNEGDKQLQGKKKITGNVPGEYKKNARPLKG